MPDQHATAGGLQDPARTLTVHAIRDSIDERLDGVLHELDEHMCGRGGRTGLADARDLLTGALHLVDALEQLGPLGPLGPIDEIYAS